MIDFNINQHVKVKLTKSGIKVGECDYEIDERLTNRQKIRLVKKLILSRLSYSFGDMSRSKIIQL